MNKNDFINNLLKTIPEFQPIYEEDRKHSEVEVHMILDDLKKFTENQVKKKNDELLGRFGLFINSAYKIFDDDARDSFFVSYIQRMDEVTLNYLSSFFDQQIFVQKTKVLKAYYRPLFEIDGEDFSDLEGFYREFSDKVLGGRISWGHSLDALNDVLHGGFGTPDEGFKLFWHNSELSRKKLMEKFDAILDIFKNHKNIKVILC